MKLSEIKIYWENKDINGILEAPVHYGHNEALAYGSGYMSAANEITQHLKALNDEGWVSVEDRLPDENRWELAFIYDKEHGIVRDAYFSNGAFCKHSGYDRLAQMGTYYVFKNVTHYILYPTPPNSRETKEIDKICEVTGKKCEYICVLGGCYLASVEPRPPKNNSEDVYRWVKASERLGDFEDSDIPECKFFNPDFCKVDDEKVDGFFRKDTEYNKTVFCYYYPVGTKFNNELKEKEFDRIEWLEKITPGTK